MDAFVRQIFEKRKKTCRTLPYTGNNAAIMRISPPQRTPESLTTIPSIKQARKNGRQESELQVTNRPQFRASDIMAYALALYNHETAHTVSQTMSMALRQFLPAKYVAEAEQMIRNGKELRASTSKKSRGSYFRQNIFTYPRNGILAVHAVKGSEMTRHKEESLKVRIIN